MLNLIGFLIKWTKKIDENVKQRKAHTWKRGKKKHRENVDWKGELHLVMNVHTLVGVLIK